MRQLGAGDGLMLMGGVLVVGSVYLLAGIAPALLVLGLALLAVGWLASAPR